jgi:uncharacterized Tic20 family protein
MSEKELKSLNFRINLAFVAFSLISLVSLPFWIASGQVPLTDFLTTPYARTEYAIFFVIFLALTIFFLVILLKNELKAKPK